MLNYSASEEKKEGKVLKKRQSEKGQKEECGQRTNDL